MDASVIDVSELFLRQHVAKHFVLLVGWETVGASKHLVRGSCFVVEVEGHWLLVTAAHTIERCRAAQQQGAQFSNWHLCDSIIDEKPLLALPFPGDLDQWITLGGEEDASGHDYAIYFIPDLVVLGLRQGGCRPIDATAWEGIAPADCDRWVMVGVPHEPDQEVPRLSMLLLDPSGPPPGTVATASPNTCFGRISNLDAPGHEPVTDIGGMSGGPVFGVKRIGGEIRYWAIGVQSGWYEKQRVAVFCLLQGFLAEVRRIVRGATQQVKLATSGR